MAPNNVEPFELVAPGLYRVADTCNAYVIVRGRRAIAVDPGSGSWFDRLQEIGVDRLEWVLLTHTHRDQCAGVYDLDRNVTRLAVPLGERHLIDDVESFWRGRQVNHNYNQIDDFLSLPRSAPVDASLNDFESFTWQGVTLDVLPAPGHSPGSIVLLTEVESTRYAIVGDMIEAPGRAPLIHSLQYAYSSATGAALLAHSLRHLLGHEPHVLLPARGPLIERPAEACEALIDRLRQLCREMWVSQDNLDGQGFIRLSEHLLESNTAGCAYYAVLDGHGRALLIDAGYPCPEMSEPCNYGYRTRFLPTGIDALRRDHDVDQIEVVIPTHYHDDHVIGIPYLQKRFDAQVWSYDRIAPILERPEAFNMPCLFPAPIHVDRRLRDREDFEWRGVQFTMHDLPGQTDLHSGISFDLDGTRWLAMGDSVHVINGKLVHGHVIYANRVTGTNHIRVAERMLEIGPQVLLHGHHRREVDGRGLADTPVTRDDLIDFRTSAGRLAGVLDQTVTDHPNRRCRADWVRVEPYRMFLQPGETADLALLAENVQDEPMTLTMRFVAPDGMSVDAPQVTCRVEAGNTHESRHRLHLHRKTTASPAILCVDVRLDGRPLGWLGHAQVWFEGMSR